MANQDPPKRTYSSEKTRLASASSLENLAQKHLNPETLEGIDKELKITIDDLAKKRLNPKLLQSIDEVSETNGERKVHDLSFPPGGGIVKVPLDKGQAVTIMVSDDSEVEIIVRPKKSSRRR